MTLPKISLHCILNIKEKSETWKSVKYKSKKADKLNLKYYGTSSVIWNG